MEGQASELLGFVDELSRRKFAELQALFDQHKAVLSSLLDQAQEEVLALVGKQQEGPPLKRPARIKSERARTVSQGDSVATQATGLSQGTEEPAIHEDAQATSGRKRRGATQAAARPAPAKRGRPRKAAEQQAPEPEGATSQSLPELDTSRTVVAGQDEDVRDDGATSAPPKATSSQPLAAPQPVQGRVTRGRARGAPAPAPPPRVTRSRKRAAAAVPELDAIQEEEGTEGQEQAVESPASLAAPQAPAGACSLSEAAAAEAATAEGMEQETADTQPEAAAAVDPDRQGASMPTQNQLEAAEVPAAEVLADESDASMLSAPAATPGARSPSMGFAGQQEDASSPSAAVNNAHDATPQQTPNEVREDQETDAYQQQQQQQQKETEEEDEQDADAETLAADEPGTSHEHVSADEPLQTCSPDAVSPAASPVISAAAPPPAAAAAAGLPAPAPAAPLSARRRSSRYHLSPIPDSEGGAALQGRRSPSLAGAPMAPPSTAGADMAASGRRSSRHVLGAASKMRSLSFGQQLQGPLLASPVAPEPAEPEFGFFSSSGAPGREPRVSFAGFGVPSAAAAALAADPARASGAPAPASGAAMLQSPEYAEARDQQQWEHSGDEAALGSQVAAAGEEDEQQQGPGEQATRLLKGVMPPARLSRQRTPTPQPSLQASPASVARPAGGAGTPVAGHTADPQSLRRLTRSAAKGAIMQQEGPAQQQQQKQQQQQVTPAVSRLSLAAGGSPSQSAAQEEQQQQQQLPANSALTAPAPDAAAKGLAVDLADSQAVASPEPAKPTASSLETAPEASLAGTTGTSEGGQANTAQTVAPAEAAGAGAAGAGAAAAGAAAGKAGSNVVTGVRSFLTSMLPKKGSPSIAAGKVKVKVKALEAAMASKKAEEARQAEKAKLKLAAEARVAAASAAAIPSNKPAPGGSSKATATVTAPGGSDATGPAQQTAAAAAEQAAQRVPAVVHEAETPAGSVAAAKVATLERMAGGNSGSGGAVRVPVAQKAPVEEDVKKAAGDKEAAKKKAEKDAEAARKPMDKQEREERMRRAEAKRKEEDARRRQELEERQRAKEERAKKQQAALAAHKAEGPAGGAGAAAFGAGGKGKAVGGGAAVATANNAAKADNNAASHAGHSAADLKSPNPTIKGASTAAGANKAIENHQPPSMQHMRTPGVALDHAASPANLIKMLAPVSNSMAPPPSQQRTAFKTPGGSALAQTHAADTPAAGPMSEQDQRNIEALKNSPFVHTSSKRTPRTAGLAMQPSSYEISPYRDDDVETPERIGKPIPDWARGARLMDALRRQQFMDPDKVFAARRTDCPLEEVFNGVEVQLDAAAASRAQRKRDFHKRTSSGDWSQDRLTWQEQVGYKKAMGYL